jgi:glycosyltransferase involved in cell wall biosynthesis
VAIEAMAFARPPIASAIGGLVEVVEDGRTGWLVAPGRADMLASTIHAIVENPELWRDFGRRARERYERLFSERSASDAMLATLKAKLNGKNQCGSEAENPPIVPDVI